jgi:hypothetical protein
VGSSVVADVAEVAIRRASGLARLEAPIGRDLPQAFIPLLAHSTQSAAVVDRFLAAAARLHVTADPCAVAAFRREADAIEALAPQLTAAKREALLSEVAGHRAGLDPALAETGAAPITRPRVGTSAAAARQSGEAAAIEREGWERLRTAALDRSSVAAIAKSTAIDRIATVIGTAEDDGWRGVYAYLAQNWEKIAERQRNYESAVSNLAANPGAAARLKLAEATTLRRGLHNKVKGLLGEAYASRCSEWSDLRAAFVDLAGYRAELLNAAARKADSPTRWKVLTVKDSIRIDKQEGWDEAVLIVEQLRPGIGRPRAKLVMAAQYKVEQRVSALKQIEKDVVREKGKIPGQAVFSYKTEGGGTVAFTLLPTSGAERPTRFLFNAEGGELSDAAVSKFAAGPIQAQRGELGASVDEFNAVTDELLAATAAVTGR